MHRPGNEGRGPAPLRRHPEDGWCRARPYRMGRSTRRAFRAQILAILPPPPAPSPPGLVDRVDAHVRRHLSYMHWTAATGLSIAIALLDWLPVLLFRSARRLQKLDRERAAEFLASLVGSRFQILRTLVVGVRGIVLSAYFDQDEVHRAIGYEPVAFISDRIALRERLLAERADSDLDEESHVRHR